MHNKLFKKLVLTTTVAAIAVGTQAIAASPASAEEVSTGKLIKQERLEKKTDRLERKADRFQEKAQRLEAKADRLEEKNKLKRAKRLDKKANRLEKRVNKLDKKAEKINKAYSEPVSIPEPGTVFGLSALGLAGVWKKFKS
ncbi:MAG: PEP-CTERM sorting domain-containing protein [Symploca sp. SIO2E9]|nr:PEP-CTERM sorting domain-containing protein [Symploca sp. SIO2E9]